MAHVVEKNDLRDLTEEAWLSDARASFDVGATLTCALAPRWTVERELDPCGDLSIVILPLSDTAALPTFVLYEKDGLAQVSTFLGEDWLSRQAFRTCRRAVAVIIAAAALAAPPIDYASSTSRTARARSSVR
jgi:hypothetical protein